MADNTKIEWADATANYCNGCSVLSAGCKRCYAMRLAGTRMKHHPTRAGLTIDSKAGPVWTGEVRTNDKVLQEVLGWKRPRRIFWNAHGDLFHENVPDAWIDRQWAVMALTPQHQHLVLTKRPERMREYCSTFEDGPDAFGEALAFVARAAGLERQAGIDLIDSMVWPLPNVALGASVEDQAARSRLVDLAQTPAAVRFVSGEPLLEGVTLTDIPLNGGPDEHGIQWLFNALTGEQYFIGDDGFTYGGDGPDMKPLDWVIAGGESGTGARPMDETWARSLRDQCQAAGVAFFMKQMWGARKPLPPIPDDLLIREIPHANA